MHSSFLLIEELQKRGRDVQIVFHGAGFARDMAAERGLPFVDLPVPGAQEDAIRDGFRLRDLVAAPACRRLIKRKAVRLVHVNDRRMLRTWAIPTRAAGRVLLAHWRSVYGPSWSVDLGLRLASHVICVSSYGRELLPSWAQSKSEVVYNPFRPTVDDSGRPALRRRIRETAGIPHDAAVVGVFGSLLERKRPHMLLRILQQLRRTADGRPVYGIVCGEILEPRDERYFRMLAAEDWEGRVVAPGHVDNVGEWMAACDAVIAPAVDEAFGRVGVEAQSAGVPVLVSSHAGLREVVEQGVSGLIIDPDDFDDWLAKVRWVLDDHDLSQRLAAGGLLAAARLSVDRHVDAIETIYDKLLSSSMSAQAMS